MLLAKFTNQSAKSLRVTQEFSQFLIKVKATNDAPLLIGDLQSSIITAYLESSGKNIDIAQRISLYKLIRFSQVIENIPTAKRGQNEHFFTLSLFNCGNFKLSDSDALIIEFENLKSSLLTAEISIFGIVDFESCEGLYKYEEKTMLQGEKEKLYNTAGVERLQISGDILEVGFYINDENGKVTERKFTKEELSFLEATQFDTNANTNVLVESIENNEPLTLNIDGVEEVKIYANPDADFNASLVMQSTTKLATSQPKSAIQTFNPSVDALKQAQFRNAFLTTNK